MNFMAQIAPVVTHPIAVPAVVAALTIWAVWSAVTLMSAISTVVRSLRRGRRLVESSSDARGFAEAFESLSAQLSADPVLGGPWRDFSASLVMPSPAQPLVRSTVRPDAWFHDGMLRNARCDLRYHAALPNLLVGAGLLFTFLGLSVALFQARGVLVLGSEERNIGLGSLLDTASFKFTTSLVGLLLSIVYAVFRKNRLARFDRALAAFLVALELRIPLLTPAALQHDANLLLERQLGQLEGFSNELAVNLASAFDRTMDARLGDHIGPLRDAIERLAGNLGARSDETLQKMLDAFLQRLQGGAGGHLEDVTRSLSTLAAQLEAVQGGLRDAAARMADAADTMARRMGEGTEQALTQITDRLGGLADSLRGIVEQMRATGDTAARDMADRIAAAAASFEAAALNIARQLADASSELQKRMTEETTAGTVQMTRQLEAMVEELRKLAAEGRASSETAQAELVGRIAAAAGAFEATANRIAEALNQGATATAEQFGRGSEDAVARIAVATEAMRNELTSMLAAFRTSLEGAGELVQQGSTEGAKALQGAIDSAGTALAARMEGAADAIRQAGEHASGALRAGGEAAGSRIEAMGREATNLATTASSLQSRIDALERVIASAADPLGIAAESMRDAAGAAQAAARPLVEVARMAATALEQLGGAAQRLETAQSTVGRMAEQIGQAAQRFEGVDRSLAATLTELQNGLRGFTQQVQGFVVTTDNNLAKAAGALGASIKELEETLDEALSRGRRGTP
jgi:ABC-type transporter Mla subunit MlaD/cbb3-type cytochrome oxidase subunit 3